VATADFGLTQGDLLPLMDWQLLNGDETAFDLTGATGVSLRFRMVEDDPSLAITAPATILDAPTGQVRYSWQPGDTNRSGIMLAEFVATFPVGLPETFPGAPSDLFPSGYIRIRVKPRL
jgi:hypothetical protein